MKEAARQTALDFLTGLGITDANSEDLQFKKRKVTGSLDDLGYEGYFVLKLNKKGRIKSASLNYEYDNDLNVEIDWKKKLKVESLKKQSIFEDIWMNTRRLWY